MIQNTLGYGSVTKRTKVNAFRFRTTKQADTKNLIQRINGFLLTENKHIQLIKLCEFYKINQLFLIIMKVFTLLKTQLGYLDFLMLKDILTL